MTFDAAMIIWGILPAVFGIFLLALSLRQSWKRKTSVNWMFTLLIVSLIGLAEIMLYRTIFEDAYASFIPHLLILGSLVLAGLQSFSRTT